MEKVHLKKIKINKKSTLIGVGILVLVLIISTVLYAENAKRSKPVIVSTSTLEKILNVSDLSTFEAIYNGVAKSTEENKPEIIDYYVSYDASVKAGIDFEKVEISVDDNEKIITVTLPEIKITDITVDIESMDFIFLNDKANTETVSEEAYKKCIEDVTDEVNSENAIYELAEENAHNIVEALISPFLSSLDSEYQLKVC